MTFPVHLLRPDDVTLCLFCAAFGGRQDAAYLRDAGVKSVLCIDNDAEKLAAMRPLYPRTWVFEADDAFGLLDDLTSQERFDVVTADPWSGTMQAEVTKRIPKLLAITRRVLILGCTRDGWDTTRQALETAGAAKWQSFLRNPQNGAVWVAVERAA